jgi:PTH1 family peptidyl-tRNA hydrolase
MEEIPPRVGAVLGLGNPGAAHRRNRHNLGFMVLDRLAERHGLRFRAERPALELCRWRVAGGPVWLGKPTTFMNLSGRGAVQLRDRHGVEAARILVVVDDLDLPLGRLRLRAGGGPGTHNGLRSLVASLGGGEFPRLRLGVGPAPGGERDLADWVLADFEPPERERLGQVLELAADCVEGSLRDGLAAAMNRFNAVVGD